MRQPASRLVAVSLALACGVVAVVAAQARVWPHEQGSAAPSQRLLALVLLVVLGAAWLYVLGAVWRRDAGGLVARLGPLAVGIFAGLVLVVVALALLLAHTDQRPANCPGCYGHAAFVAHPNYEGGAAAVRGGGAANRRSRSVAVTGWVWVLLGAAVAVGLTMLGYVLLRRRSGEGDDLEDQSLAVVERFVEQSLAELQRERDLRKAIVACYARMERLLSSAGLRRERFESPFEYLGRIVSDLPGGRRAIERLTVLFEEAEFSRHELSERMRAEAIASLVDLRAACEAR